MFKAYPVLFLGLFLAAGGSHAALRDDLSLVTDLSPGDSIVSLHSDGDKQVLLKVFHEQKIEVRKLSVSGAMHDKLLKEAALENRHGDEIRPEPAVKQEISEDVQSRNRTSFNRVQGAFGAVAFYYATILGIQPTNESALLGLCLIGYPASYLGHYLYSRDRTWTDAHLDGTGYLSSMAWMNSLYGTIALGGFTEGSVRAAGWTSLIAYPIGLHLGYQFGDRYSGNPGRVSFVQSLASQGMFTGALLPLTFADWDNMSSTKAEIMFRLSALGAIGGGIGGHILAQNMMTGKHIPAGVGPGISTLARLGGATGFEIALLSAGQGDLHPNTAIGLALAGNTLGALAGISLLPDRADTKERSTYIDVGTSLGALGGLGVLLMAQPKSPSTGEVLAYPTIGAWAGYGLTTLITSQLVETKAVASNTNGLIGDVSVASALVPQSTEHGMRWAWPGVTVSLR